MTSIPVAPDDRIEASADERKLGRFLLLPAKICYQILRVRAVSLRCLLALGALSCGGRTELNDQGKAGCLLLDLQGDTCSPQSTGFPDRCFVRDGNLGTLSDAHQFIAMTEDGAGSVFALVDRAPDGSRDRICSQPCTLQRIDVMTRTIRWENGYAFAGGKALSLHYDPFPKQLIFAYTPATAEFDQAGPGFTIELLAYE